MAFNTASGQTIERELLIAYVNISTTAEPSWKPIGSRVEDSSMEYDFSLESTTDILGKVRNTMKKPVITQSFDPMPLDAGDEASAYIWNLAVKEQNYNALAAQDMLIVHCYDGTASTAMTAERYSACAIAITGLGGEGGGSIDMPFDVTYGGDRTLGTAAISNGNVTFTAAA